MLRWICCCLRLGRICCRCDVCPSQRPWRQATKPKPVAVGLSPMHHPSSFPSSAQRTGWDAAAYQDYAGHHEAKQADRDDDARDQIVPRVKLLLALLPRSITIPLMLIPVPAHLFDMSVKLLFLPPHILVKLGKRVSVSKSFDSFRALTEA